MTNEHIKYIMDQIGIKPDRPIPLRTLITFSRLVAIDAVLQYENELKVKHDAAADR